MGPLRRREGPGRAGPGRTGPGGTWKGGEVVGAASDEGSVGTKFL